MNGIRKCIYMLISPSKKVYMKKSVCIKQRFGCYRNLHKNSIGPLLYRALKKHGWNNFVKVIIEVFDDNYEFLNEREIYWIKYHEAFGPKGYNCTTGGDGAEGRNTSEETRSRISAGLLFYHANLTDEQKTKERQRNKSQKKAVIATEKSTGIKRKFESIFVAAHTLANETGKKFSRGNISNCATKRPHYNSHLGWTFEFEE